VDQGAGDRDLLPHPSREGGEPAVEHVVEAEELRELRGARVRVGDVVEPREEAEVAAKRHALVERGLVGDEPTARADRVGVLCYRYPVDEHVAFARCEDPADDAARGRLARAVRAEQCHDLARMDLERHVVKGQRAVEATRNVAHVDHLSSIRAL